MIVLDASAAIELLLRTPTGLAVEARALDESETLHAPELLDLEVVQVLRCHRHLGDLTRARADEAFADLRALPLERYPHGPLLARVWELRENLTAYDAAYVALAEALRAPLLTLDGPLARSAVHRAVIEVVGRAAGA